MKGDWMLRRHLYRRDAWVREGEPGETYRVVKREGEFGDRLILVREGRAGSQVRVGGTRRWYPTEYYVLDRASEINDRIFGRFVLSFTRGELSNREGAE